MGGGDSKSSRLDQFVHVATPLLAALAGFVAGWTRDWPAAVGAIALCIGFAADVYARGWFPGTK